MRKVAVTTTKKSHATITLAWLWTKVSQRCLESGVRTGPACKYLFTVRGDTRIPSLSFNSLAMRSSPQVGFSVAISRINCRRSLGRRGCPVGLDFQRQSNRNPLRCHRMRVSGFTFTSELPHGNIRLRVAIIHRMEWSARRGLTFRSWNSASCLRNAMNVPATLENENTLFDGLVDSVTCRYFRKKEEILRRQGTAGMHREASESDQVDDDQRQRPGAVCNGAGNR